MLVFICIYAEYSLIYRVLLQKRPIILRSLLSLLICIHVYTYISISVCLAALPQCLRTYAYMRIWTYVCTYVYRYMYVGIKKKSINSADTSHLRHVSLTALLQCLRTYAYIHICIYVYMYMHIYMNVCGSWPQHTHTHTHLQGLCCGKNPPLVTCLDTCEYINVYCIQKRH